ncbi:MAG: class I SAM-dependent methyltransferase [Balneolaceae bacterium]
MINDRDTIVECGAGISSIYIGALLNQIGNDKKKLYTIDHDENWLSILQRELDQNSLSEYVTLIHAPLKHCKECAASNLKWYDTTVIQEQIFDVNIDLLFVDGPVANKKELELARYPALPVLKDKLSDEFLVLLHDAHRKGETRIASKWSDELGIKFRKSILNGDIYIGLKGSSYNVL